MDENDYSGDAILQIYEDIKGRVGERHARFAKFARHAVLWMIVVIIFLFVDVGQNEMSYLVGMALVIAMGAWLFIVGAHLANWLLFVLHERALWKEIERSGIGLYQRRLADKRKRETEVPGERLVRLTDDGEIIDLEEDEEHEVHYG